MNSPHPQKVGVIRILLRYRISLPDSDKLRHEAYHSAFPHDHERRPLASLRSGMAEIGALPATSKRRELNRRRSSAAAPQSWCSEWTSSTR